MEPIYDTSGNIVGYIGNHPGCCVAVLVTPFLILGTAYAEVRWVLLMFITANQVDSLFRLLLLLSWLMGAFVCIYFAQSKFKEGGFWSILHAIWLGTIALFALGAFLYVVYMIILGSIQL